MPGQTRIDIHTLARLRTSEARYRRLFENARDGMLLLSAGTFRIEDVNPCLVKMLGHSRGELVGRSLGEVGLLADAARAEPLFEQLRTEDILHIEVLVLCTCSGAQIEVEFVSIRYECEGTLVIQCNVRDITERRSMERRLQQLAFHDPLTLLPNRRLLLDRLQHAIHASRRNNTLGAVMFIDLYRFKALNDAQGHAAGDQLLIETARRLQRVARESDTVARFGGDEFVILLDQLGKDAGLAARAAAVVTAKVQAALASGYTLGTHEYQGSCSIGTRLFTGAEGDAEQIIRAADLEMYRSKRANGSEGIHRPLHEDCVGGSPGSGRRIAEGAPADGEPALDSRVGDPRREMRVKR